MIIIIIIKLACCDYMHASQVLRNQVVKASIEMDNRKCYYH